ncbi:uncharacterized protein BCR38DRAFT_338205 [Pseudomassariella vexata]|uniref:Ribosomal protein S17 n=1 Tax=Pseudomassariella vexata TaxID=1141098 RepID=A0A1Y2E691_9PEZI|nr:uncharacterized protein BCR38DRAFT_338205 [Pseudomassariella vexata]ORY67078.1 hypothetical protein BCR38DRAFT_338205 [Pseudomassariella vexata]
MNTTAAKVATTAANQAAQATKYVPIAGRELKHWQTGVVVSAGLMDRTVKVRLWGKRWEKKVSKYFKVPSYHLVHDPNNSVRKGDVIACSSGWKTSKMKRFIVRHIVAPWGPGIHERPPVPDEDELIVAEQARRAKMEDKKAAKAKEARRLAVEAKQAKLAKKAEREAFMNKNKEPQVQTSIDDVD